MTGPKPIVFDENPVDLNNVDDFHPLPVSFDKMCDAYKNQQESFSLKEQMDILGQKKAKAHNEAQRLEEEMEIQRDKIHKVDFKNIAPVQPKVAAAKTVFQEQNPYASIITAAVNHVKTNFQPLISELPSIERQIKQLLPLKADNIVTWGSSALEQEANLSLNIAKFIKRTVELNGNETLERVLNSLKPAQPGLFGKMFGPKHEQPQSFKPSLVALKEQLKLIPAPLEQFIADASKSETRIMIQLASLVAVREVVGQSKDDSIEHAVSDRRTILQQAAMQAKLARLQLLQTQTNIIDELSRTDQILNITLPAYELAQTQK